jgi:hypothetical protein
MRTVKGLKTITTSWAIEEKRQYKKLTCFLTPLYIAKIVFFQANTMISL